MLAGIPVLMSTRSPFQRRKAPDTRTITLTASEWDAVIDALEYYVHRDHVAGALKKIRAFVLDRNLVEIGHVNLGKMKENCKTDLPCPECGAPLYSDICTVNSGVEWCEKCGLKRNV